jgi:hypothetical protein
MFWGLDKRLMFCWGVVRIYRWSIKYVIAVRDQCADIMNV